MKHTIRNQNPVIRRNRWIAGILALFGAGAILVPTAFGEGVVQVFTSKSLPEATVAVIDPESGTSTGTEGSDVNLAPGDIILFKFNFLGLSSDTKSGLNSYLTEYIPFNTEVVGARIIDENGLTIHPRRAGWSVDGCATAPNCGGTFNVNCSTGTCTLNQGSVYDVQADTGIFYTTDALLERNPAEVFLTKENGTLLNPEPRHVSPLKALLDYSGNAVAHNQWDYNMVQAFGLQNDQAGTGANGDAPYQYGSPVAGPDTHYPYAPIDPGGGTLEFNGDDGPWLRMVTPGARMASGGVGTGSAAYARDDIDASGVGTDVTPANPVQPTALRYALGETRTGEQTFAEVALRVLDVPIDPNFGTEGGNIDCAEVFGTDVAADGNGNDHPWGFYVSSPACAYLKLLFDVTPSELLSGSQVPISFTINGSNLSVQDETNVEVRLEHENGSFVSATPPPTMVMPCPTNTAVNCVTWNLGTLAPGEDYEITANFTTPGGGGTTFVVDGRYLSDSLPFPGYVNQTVSLVRGITVVKAELAHTATQTAPGNVATMTGEIRNEGTGLYTLGASNTLFLTLPSGWTMSGTWTLGGVAMTCSQSGDVVACDPDNSVDDIAAGGSRSLSISADVPGGEANGLYDIDLQLFGNQSMFGPEFETFFPSVATVAVGQVRSTPPMLDCPINSSDASGITGTTVEADGTVIRLYFNLIERGDGTSTSGAWEVSNFGAFGELYGGLEVRATAQAPGELESELSDACFVTATRACQDGVDNDGDGFTDFPADPGCDSPSDNSEDDPPALECNNTQDDDNANGIDWPEDPSCYAYYDPSEDGQLACTDSEDNDGDGLTDGADPDCAASGGQTEHTFMACQDGIDNDGDLLVDFPEDPGCHSEFDNDETDTLQTDGDKARILVILDSSGSMNLDTCEHPADVNGFTGGDGSDECPGDDVSCSFCNAPGCDNGEADDSRLYKIKAGLTNVVAAFGEIDWGLMRFFQKDVEFTCPNQNASLASGAWQGGGAPPCGGGFNAGELLVSFAPDNPETILNWIDNNSNYPGVEAPRDLDWEVRGSGTTPLGGALDSALTYMTAVESGDIAPADCRPYRVVLLTDGLETCGGDPEGSAAALLSAGMPVYVIGFATADQEIVTQLNAIAMSGGTNQAIFVDDDVELSAAFADIVQETVRFEICDGEDNDCDGDIDEDFPDLDETCNNGEAGECFDTGTVVCSTTDPSTTECNAPPGMPQPEECNGLDDDCDNLIDEALVDCDCTPFPEVCNNADDDCDGEIDEAPVTGVGTECGLDGPLAESICEPGMLACNPGGNLECEGGVPPGTEVCNDLDDDCDGQIDEVSSPCYGFATGCDVNTGNCVGTCQIGVETCDTAMGECDGDVGPGGETCNTEDDDCDGAVDEDFPTLGDMCTRGLGVCQTTGNIVCDADDVEMDGDFVRCNALEVSGTDEVCNNLDDDCDGDIDEDLGPPFTGCGPDGMDACPCGGGQGCSGGVFQCNDGVSECVGGNEGATEICNGIDEDCDSSIDEGTSTFEDCVPPSQQTACDPDCTGTMICVDGTCVAGDTGECDFGQLECVNGSDQCQGFDGPTPEVCNGEDDNCDGMVDNEAICPNPNNICIEGACVFPCGDDEFPCPFGYYCETITDEGDYCLPDPCVVDNVQCQPGEFCQSGTGECIDLCDGVNCAEGEMCQNGQCIDCFDTGCPDGQECVRQDNNVGVCEDDPCYQVECEDDEFCRDGNCIPVGCDPECGSGEACVDGECVTDNCAGVECTSGRVCDPSTGECTADRCFNVNCPTGQVCQPSSGQCINDPCVNLNCPDGTQCQVDFDGSGVCTDIVGEYVFAGGSGCGCQSSGGPGQAGGILLMLGLAYLGLGRRRRRRKA